jgi:hypothetical protein
MAPFLLPTAIDIKVHSLFTVKEVILCRTGKPAGSACGFRA